MTINKERFLEEAENNDVVWIGEIHGIKENYALYRMLITELVSKGFKNVALELPKEDHPEYKDGRFSVESKEFLEWLDGLVDKGDLGKVIRFDERGEENGLGQQNSEDKLAEVLLRELTNSKTIVITGNFHSETKRQKVSSEMEVLPAAGIVVKSGRFKIVFGDLKYAGGSFYNFGVKKITPDFLSFDSDGLAFGSFMPEKSRRGERWSIHLGIVSPVELLD